MIWLSAWCMKRHQFGRNEQQRNMMNLSGRLIQRHTKRCKLSWMNPCLLSKRWPNRKVWSWFTNRNWGGSSREICGVVKRHFDVEQSGDYHNGWIYKTQKAKKQNPENRKGNNVRGRKPIASFCRPRGAWDAEGAISQIKQKNYVEALQDYKGNPVAGRHQLWWGQESFLRDWKVDLFLMFAENHRKPSFRNVPNQTNVL